MDATTAYSASFAAPPKEKSRRLVKMVAAGWKLAKVADVWPQLLCGG